MAARGVTHLQIKDALAMKASYLLLLACVVLIASVGCNGTARRGSSTCGDGACGRPGLAGRMGGGGGGLAGGGCGPGGCGAGGLAGQGQHHGTRTFNGPSGPPTGAVAYPYYTTRGPRDFLVDNPPSIGY